MTIEQGQEEPNSNPKVLSNPHGQLPNGRKRFCGVWTLRGTRKAALSVKHRRAHQAASARAPREKYVRLRCKCWACTGCGPRKARQLRAQMLRVIAQTKMDRLLTLTLDARKIASPEASAIFLEHLESQKSKGKACRCVTCSGIQVQSIRHIKACWAKLRTYLKRRIGSAPLYICVLEFQKFTGLAHLHIVIDHYVDQAWAKKSWSAIGGGEHVDIRQVNSRRVAAYVSKYLSKDLVSGAPVGTRRVTTSRSINLNPKKESDSTWIVLRFPIDRAHAKLRDVARDEVVREGELESFTVPD